MNFSKDFTWGAATASYQIEGAWNEDGKGESIWDRFSHTPGNVDNGDTGDVAVDHYHRWQDDIRLMSSIGLQAYRFSIAWTRILPGGTGTVNSAGLDFYSRLVDGLLEAGIRPFATLYHWDLPQALQDRGGWPVRATAEAFAEYADHVTRCLGDRVSHWATLNEPFVSSFVGHLEGRHAPGHRDLGEAVAASHHLLLAHGLAMPVIRANAPGSRAGIVLDLFPKQPASPSLADRRAALYEDGKLNRWFLDALFGRGYPQDMVEAYRSDQSFVQPGDMDTISAPIDFLGVNYYSRNIVRSREIGEAENLPRTNFQGEEFTEMNWEVYPQGLYETLGRLHFEYRVPSIYITENGAAYEDVVSADGAVHDPARLSYIHRHLEIVEKAIAIGVPVDGYFVWSLFDNFEWALGYAKRFGIVHVDYETQRRTLKSSARWYRDVIRGNGALHLAGGSE